MSVYKTRIKQKNASGGYDILYPETTQDVVKVQNDLTLQDITTITTGELASGQTYIKIDNPKINKWRALSFYTSIYGVSPYKVNVESGYVELRFYPQRENMTVGVRIDG